MHLALRTYAGEYFLSRSPVSTLSDLLEKYCIDMAYIMVAEVSLYVYKYSTFQEPKHSVTGTNMIAIKTIKS